MKILIYARPFFPSVGGVEEVTRLLALEMQTLGHSITVATQTVPTGDNQPEMPFRVVRGPSLVELYVEARNADVVLLMGPSLRAALPVIASGTPLVIAHHIVATGADQSSLVQRVVHPLKAAAKRFICRSATNMFVSDYVRRAARLPGYVTPNPVDVSRFASLVESRKTRDVIFVGRMIADKGPEVLLEAIRCSAANGGGICATFVGEGPEQSRLAEVARSLGIAAQVRFTGALVGEALAAELAAHRVIAIPSICEEAFGMVALEAMAAGVCVVATKVGGLPETIGSAGLLVEPRNAVPLGLAVKRCLEDARLREDLLATGTARVRRHAPNVIAQEWLAVLELSAIQDSPRRATPIN